MACSWCGEFWDEDCTCGPLGAGNPKSSYDRCMKCMNYKFECDCQCCKCGLSVNLYSGRKLCDGHPSAPEDAKI